MRSDIVSHRSRSISGRTGHSPYPICIGFFFSRAKSSRTTIVFAELGRLLKKGLVIKGSDGGSVSSDRAELAELRRFLAQSTPLIR